METKVFLDKVKFYYYSRASLSEGINDWLDLLIERDKTSKELAEGLKKVGKDLEIKLNRFIKTTLQQGNRS